ncbi:MAG: hypothetical protein HRF50_09195 [Phycisphaerae bacterium]
MIRQPLTAAERLQLLNTRAAALRDYDAAMERIARCAPAGEAEFAAVAAAEEHLRAAELAEGAYFDRLPRAVMSCCPFDNRPLVRTFDPYAFDGPWWRPDADPQELPSCPHFCLVRAAVRLNESAERLDCPSSNAGPNAPYVNPRLLNQPGMIAVLSELSMAAGHAVVVIAYFAPRRPPAQNLAASWPRGVYLYTTALGQHRWRLDDAERDFNLRPWLEQRKLRWCEPDANNERLSADPPDRCPYLASPDPRPSAAATSNHRPD